jgi:hypothetical protein
MERKSPKVIVTEVTVEYGRTFGMPNYGSARFSVSMTAQLQPGQAEGDVVRALQAECVEHVREQALPLLNKQATSFADVVNHLPPALKNKVRGIIEEELDPSING